VTSAVAPNASPVAAAAIGLAEILAVLALLLLLIFLIARWLLAKKREPEEVPVAVLLHPKAKKLDEPVLCEVSGSWKARVISFSNVGNGVVFYTIEVEHGGEGKWTVEKRYTQFQQLFLALKNRSDSPKIKEFQFPQKDMFWQDNNKVAKAREPVFDDLCQIMVGLEPVPPYVIEFLRNPNANATSLAKNSAPPQEMTTTICPSDMPAVMPVVETQGEKIVHAAKKPAPRPSWPASKMSPEKSPTPRDSIVVTAPQGHALWATAPIVTEIDLDSLMFEEEEDDNGGTTTRARLVSTSIATNISVLGALQVERCVIPTYCKDHPDSPRSYQVDDPLLLSNKPVPMGHKTAQTEFLYEHARTRSNPALISKNTIVLEDIGSLVPQIIEDKSVPQKIASLERAASTGELKKIFEENQVAKLRQSSLTFCPFVVNGTTPSNCADCSQTIAHVLLRYSGFSYKQENGGDYHKECWEKNTANRNQYCLQCNTPIAIIYNKSSGKFYEVDNGKVHMECWDNYRLKIAPNCVSCGESCAQMARFSGVYYELNNRKNCHVECFSTKTMPGITKVVWESKDNSINTMSLCAQCNEVVLKIGKFSGAYYKVVENCEVHEECWEVYRTSTAAQCAHCSKPVTCVQGQFSGAFYEVDNLKVHAECWEPYVRKTYAKCVHCNEPCCRLGNFSGKSYLLDDGYKCHVECYEEFQATKDARACTFCNEKIVRKAGIFSGVYYNVADKDYVHEECWDSFRLGHCDRCFYCDKPVTRLKGQFDGTYYETEYGKVHTECWSDYQIHIAPTCPLCLQPCIESDGEAHELMFCVLEDGSKCHYECRNRYASEKGKCIVFYFFV